MGAPATLPAGFFDSDQAPQSLPKGFFSRQAPRSAAEAVAQGASPDELLRATGAPPTQRPIVSTVRSPLTGTPRNVYLGEPAPQYQAPSEFSGMNTTPEEDAQNALATSAALGLASNPIGFGKTLLKSAIGSAGGGFLGSEIGRPWGPNASRVGGEIGAVAGGITAPLLGEPPIGRTGLLKSIFGKAEEEKAPYTPLTQSPNYPNLAAARKLAMQEARDRLSHGPGRVGSAQQESGYYPSVTKVPIRPEPPYKLTPESVPGPDTSGKGNLLTPLAKKGDQRAGQELIRRGRTVLYVPAENYPPPREVTTFGAQESPLEKTQLGGSKHSSIISRLGEGTELGGETPKSIVGLGPPVTRQEIQRAADQLPPETPQEANRRRYITAQIRHSKMK